MGVWKVCFANNIQCSGRRRQLCSCFYVTVHPMFEPLPDNGTSFLSIFILVESIRIVLQERPNQWDCQIQSTGTLLLTGRSAATMRKIDAGVPPLRHRNSLMQHYLPDPPCEAWPPLRPASLARSGSSAKLPDPPCDCWPDLPVPLPCWLPPLFVPELLFRSASVSRSLSALTRIRHLALASSRLARERRWACCRCLWRLRASDRSQAWPSSKSSIGSRR
jgi:hypothetical protein